MNAVERLLAHGERLLSLFDEMYRKPDQESWGFAVFLEPSVEQMPPAFYSEPWASIYWWYVAVTAVEAEVGRKGGPIGDLASTLLRERLSMRLHLLDRSVWQQLVADVVRECRAWDFLAKKVVRLAQEVADSAIFIEEEVTPLQYPDTWQTWRYSLHRNLGLLRRYAQPPAPAKSSPKQKTAADKQPKNRSRKGIGGRPAKFTLRFIREVVTARERDERQAVNAKQPLPPFPRWLRDYCDGHGIDIRERFPPAAPGEEWSRRANRFWKAAKVRLSRSGN